MYATDQEGLSSQFCGQSINMIYAAHEKVFRQGEMIWLMVAIGQNYDLLGSLIHLRLIESKNLSISSPKDGINDIFFLSFKEKFNFSNKL